MARAGLYKDDAGGERGWTVSIWTRQDCWRTTVLIEGEGGLGQENVRTG